jgi:fused signal recognition particle receptor
VDVEPPTVEPQLPDDAAPLLDEPAPQEPVRKRKAAPAKRGRRREPDIVRAVSTESGDHVPLATDDERPKERTEPKLLLRQRFRRGLKRTRDRLGAELREAFTGGATPEAFDRIEESLVAADVGAATATTVTDQLRDQIGLSDTTLAGAVRDVMVAQLADADRRLRLVRGRLSVWVVVGVNGTGKTTTIAKLAARAKDLGVPVSLAAADTFRAAAVEQLAEWGRRLDVPVTKQSQGADPGAVVFDAIAHAKANGHRLLIVDTAGRLHTRKPLMDELQKVIRVIERTEDATIAECLLVIDATTGQNGIAQAKAFKDAVSVTGLTIAKLDGTAKGGIAFAVEKELGVPVKAVGVGEREKDLVPFEPKAFVDALIGEDD